MRKATAILVFISLMLTGSPSIAENRNLNNPELAGQITDGRNATSLISNTGFGLYRPEFQEDSSYNFRNLRWGMSPGQVSELMGKPTRHDTNNKTGVYRMGYKDVDLFGIKIWLVCSFVNNQLWGAGYAKDYAGEGEFEAIAAEALAFYGRVEPLVENRTTEYEWAQGDTVVVLRLVDDPRLGRRIFFNFISEALSPEPVIRRGMFAP